MANKHTMKMIEAKIDLVEAAGFGEVNIKIKNSAVYRALHTIDTYVGKPELDKEHK